MLKAFSKAIGLGGEMAREPRLAEMFDRREDTAVDSQDPSAQPSGRLEDENLSQQYYGPHYQRICLHLDATIILKLKVLLHLSIFSGC